ncbi:MAG: AbrB/MazE/SpoVT family DNA-binding domain-containing protein [Desulfobacterales bacterium]|nr:AbrB/MazE/SpoVT family DNA-binding domain-containing protein [Desulfobacterales bacterium]
MTVSATTKMSSKGQVVIPEEIRNRLGLKAGSQFVVVGEKDTVIFKAILPPSMEEFDDLIAQARCQARKIGITRSDVAEAIARVRGYK